jgi:hypothetical protein
MSEASRIDHSKKHPTHICYSVRDGKEGHKARWSEIGAAWATKDGKGFVLHLNAMPIDGRVVMVQSDGNR